MSFVTDDPSCGADVNYVRSKFFPATHLHSSQHCSRLVPLVRSSMSPDPAESLRRSNCTSPQRDQHAQWILLYWISSSQPRPIQTKLSNITVSIWMDLSMGLHPFKKHHLSAHRRIGYLILTWEDNDGWLSGRDFQVPSLPPQWTKFQNLPSSQNVVISHPSTRTTVPPARQAAGCIYCSLNSTAWLRLSKLPVNCSFWQKASPSLHPPPPGLSWWSLRSANLRPSSVLSTDWIHCSFLLAFTASHRRVTLHPGSSYVRFSCCPIHIKSLWS